MIIAAPKYRHVFEYSYFNKIQSIVFDDVLYTDKSIVVSAPTGSGKTVILELAIVRLLMKLEELNYSDDFKIVYMAPVKALCTERLMDWYGKFTKLGIPCIEVTGDTDSLDFNQLKSYRIIMTTPEKWDSMTRRWKDNKFLVQVVKLFIIDEVHLLNEDVRGPVLEAVVSRMKTIQESIAISNCEKTTPLDDYNIGADWTIDSIFEDNDKEDAGAKSLPINIRFIAISATIPNAEDIAEWLGTRDQAAACYKIGEEFRPVKLTKVVEGYPCKEGESLFKFDFCLNYKLKTIIERYCAGKPTLIFCNTRKSVIMAAETLSKDILFEFSPVQKERFSRMAAQLSEKKLQALVLSGIGCHHAGFTANNRNIIEQMFRQGDLPVLITTSTLAMGVNLPAHLVIIKTTQHYVNGAYKEYEESTILQMMGRAGRPQFDTEGVAVIMTRNQDKDRYERLCGGRRCVESALHRHLTEHLNAEAALGTLPDLVAAADWIRSTFLYVRAVKNPTHYGYRGCDRDRVEKKLEELCLKSMNALARVGLLTMDADTRVTPTDAGYLMAAHCLDFETMKLILKIKGTETLSGLLFLVSECHEFSDMVLRTSEKRCLNILNKNAKSPSCRFPLPGKIQTKSMKVNCLIQSVFGCLPIPDPSINQEALKIVRIGEHITKCISTYITRPSSVSSGHPIYKTVLNSTVLAKCFAARLWENSTFVARQLTGIGPAFASLLANASKTTFESIRLSNPRDLERITNKLPPAGNLLLRQVVLLPTYEISMKVEPQRKLSVCVLIKNHESLLNGGTSTTGDKHKISIIVGDSENNLLLNHSIHDFSLLHHPNAEIAKIVTLKCSTAHTVFAHCISNTWVGLDVQCQVKVKRSLTDEIPITLQQSMKNFLKKSEKFPKSDTNNTETLQQIEDFNYDFCDVVEPSQETNEYVIPKKRAKSNMAQKKNVKKTKTAEPKVASQKSKDIMEQITSYLNEIPPLSNMRNLSIGNRYHKPLPGNFSKDNDIEFKLPDAKMKSKILTGTQHTEKISDFQQPQKTSYLSNDPKLQIIAQHKNYNDSTESIFDKPHIFNENEYYEDSPAEAIDEPSHSEMHFDDIDTLVNNNSVCNDLGTSYEDWRRKLAARTLTMSNFNMQSQNPRQQNGEYIRVKNSHEYSNALLNSRDNLMETTQSISDHTNTVCQKYRDGDKLAASDDSCIKSHRSGLFSNSIERYDLENGFPNTYKLELTKCSDSSDENEKHSIMYPSMMSQSYKHPYFGIVNDNSQYNLSVAGEMKIIDLTLEPEYNSIVNIHDNSETCISHIEETCTDVMTENGSQFNHMICGSADKTIESSTDITLNTEEVSKGDDKELPVPSNKEPVSVDKKRKCCERRYIQLPITSFMKAKKIKLDENINAKSSPGEHKSKGVELSSEIRNDVNDIIVRDYYSSILDKNISQPDVNAMNEVHHCKTLVGNVIQKSFCQNIDEQNEFLSLDKKKRYVSWSSPLILPPLQTSDNVITYSEEVALQNNKIENMKRANQQINEVDFITKIGIPDQLENSTFNFDINDQDMSPFVEKINKDNNVTTGCNSLGLSVTYNINVQVNINTTKCNNNDGYDNAHLDSCQPKIRCLPSDRGDLSVLRPSKTIAIIPVNSTILPQKSVSIQEIVQDGDTKEESKMGSSIASSYVNDDVVTKCNQNSGSCYEKIEKIKPKTDIENQLNCDINNWLQNSSCNAKCDLVTDIDVSSQRDYILYNKDNILPATEEDKNKNNLNLSAPVSDDPYAIEIEDLLKKYSSYQTPTQDNSQIGQELLDTSWEKDFEGDGFPETCIKTIDKRKTEADICKSQTKISINDVFKYENDEIFKNYQNLGGTSDLKSKNSTSVSYCRNVFKSFSDKADCVNVQCEINNSTPNLLTKDETLIPYLNSYNLQSQTESENLSIDYDNMMNPMSVLTSAYGPQNNAQNFEGIDNQNMEDIDFPEFNLSGELYYNKTNETFKLKRPNADFKINYNNSIHPEHSDNLILPRYKEFDSSSRNDVFKSPLFVVKENRKLFSYNQKAHETNETVSKVPTSGYGRWEKYLDSSKSPNNQHGLFDFGYEHHSSSTSLASDDNFINPTLQRYLPREHETQNQHMNSIMERFYINMQSQLNSAKRETENKILDLKIFELTPKPKL